MYHVYITDEWGEVSLYDSYDNPDSAHDIADDLGCTAWVVYEDEYQANQGGLSIAEYIARQRLGED